MTRGTIKPADPYDAEKAATDIQKAMKGIGTDEKAIIRVLTGHSNEQRQGIRKSFKGQYGKDMGAELKSELSGHFEKLCLSLIEPSVQFDVKELHDATSGIGTREKTLIDILCSRSNSEIEEIKKVYKLTYSSDLESDIAGDTSGHLKCFLVSQLAANRSEDESVDMDMAEKDAGEFYEAGPGQFGTDESTFNRILSTRSYPQLVAMFDAYKAKYDQSVEKAISSETSGAIEDGYLSIARIARSKPVFYAERLYKSMKGIGTDNDVLIRVVVTRCEIDMVEIKECFMHLYDKTLVSFINGDCSGDYKRCLKALIGE